MTDCDSCWHQGWCEEDMRPCPLYEPRSAHPGIHYDKNGNRCDLIRNEDGTYTEIPLVQDASGKWVRLEPETTGHLEDTK